MPLHRETDTLVRLSCSVRCRTHTCLHSHLQTQLVALLANRALRYLYSYESSQTSTLFDRIGYSLVDRRIQNLLIIVFKTINNYPPEYLRDLFRLRDNIKNLRGVNKLQVPKPNTTRYGKNSVKYLAAITWYKISDTLRSLSISLSTSLSTLSAIILNNNYILLCN